MRREFSPFERKRGVLSVLAPSFLRPHPSSAHSLKLSAQDISPAHRRCLISKNINPRSLLRLQDAFSQKRKERSREACSSQIPFNSSSCRPYLTPPPPPTPRTKQTPRYHTAALVAKVVLPGPIGMIGVPPLSQGLRRNNRGGASGHRVGMTCPPSTPGILMTSSIK